VEQALTQLAQARRYAEDAGVGLWDFAVEIGCLVKQGLTMTDLRWLVAKGYLLHGTDQLLTHGLSRQIQISQTLKFVSESCFIISKAGLEFVNPSTCTTSAHDANEEDRLLPLWDDERQELRMGNVLVKKFKLPAPNQRKVLVAFEEENWPYRIDDPLPQHSAIDPKRRLHHTLVALNRNHRCEAIRFLGDGTGEGVCWDQIDRGRNELSYADCRAQTFSVPHARKSL
jgi:hypothetical protein